MNIADAFWHAWPWVGLGMGIVMLVLLFATDLLRATGCPRWRDPYWLAWAAMPAYLVHQFEEYALNVVDGNYVIIEQVFSTVSGILDLSALPMLHVPLVNIALVWFGVPLAAWLGTRIDNPAVAHSPYGFILVIGHLHFAMTAVRGVPVPLNPGFFTGTLVFL
ncbi:MAG: HXXEE domain-containing protein, partial [Eggerthellaceae bacterium]|nr:HXXEE domain-containing protein [Eggerthellaceae bacterium]